MAELVDVESLLSADGSNFSDICHLTVAGQQRFVDAVAPAAVRILTTDRPSHFGQR